jgi:hypothetical protein
VDSCLALGAISYIMRSANSALWIVHCMLDVPEGPTVAFIRIGLNFIQFRITSKYLPEVRLSLEWVKNGEESVNSRGLTLQGSGRESTHCVTAVLFCAPSKQRRHFAEANEVRKVGGCNVKNFMGGSHREWEVLAKQILLQGKIMKMFRFCAIAFKIQNITPKVFIEKNHYEN